MLSLDGFVDRLIGLTVTDIEMNEFWHGQSKKLIGLILSFEDESVLSIRLNGDGTGFILEDHRPEKLDLGEFGQTSTITWTDRFGGKVRLPSGFCAVTEEKSLSKDHNGFAGCSSLTISLDSSPKIAVLNCGDELNIVEAA